MKIESEGRTPWKPSHSRTSVWTSSTSSAANSLMSLVDSSSQNSAYIKQRVKESEPTSTSGLGGDGQARG